MKAALRAELLAQLSASLESARAAHASAIEGATHPEAKAENAKDTRGLEQSYIARGQAQRVAELEAAVADTTALVLRELRGGPIALTALVTLEEAGAEVRYFLAPHGGGAVLAGGVQVVTPQSPLGRALLGKHVDDTIELRARELTITEIA